MYFSSISATAPLILAWAVPAISCVNKFLAAYRLVGSLRQDLEGSDSFLLLLHLVLQFQSLVGFCPRLRSCMLFVLPKILIEEF
jgi:hypothetical protein